MKSFLGGAEANALFSSLVVLAADVKDNTGIQR